MFASANVVKPPAYIPPSAAACSAATSASTCALIPGVSSSANLTPAGVVL